MKHLAFLALFAILFTILPGVFCFSASASSSVWGTASGNVTVDGDEIVINPNTSKSPWTGFIELKEYVDAGQSIEFSYDISVSEGSYTVWKMTNNAVTSWLFGRVQYNSGKLYMSLQMLFNGTWYSYDDSYTPCTDKDYTIKFVLDFNRDTFSIISMSNSGYLVYFKEHSTSEFPDTDFFEEGKITCYVGAENYGKCATTIITNPQILTDFPSVSIVGNNIISADKEVTYTYSASKTYDSVTWKLISDDGIVTTSYEKNFTFTPGNKDSYTISLTIPSDDGDATYYKSIRSITRTPSDTDMAPLPFEKVLFVNTTGIEDDWMDLVGEEVDEYQVEKASYSCCDVNHIEDADLMVIDVGTTLYKGNVSASDFKTYYENLISTICEKYQSAVLVLMNVSAPTSYTETMTLEKLVDYNYIIESTARNNKAIYVDVYSATSFASWNRNDDTLIAQKVYGMIAKYCSCLSNSSVFPIQNPYEALPIEKVDNTKFATALKKITDAISKNDADGIRDNLDEDSLYYDNSSFHYMDYSQKNKLYQKMITDGKTATLKTHEDFVKFYNSCAYAVIRDNQNTDMFNGEVLETFVTVGQSVDAGATVTSASYYAWPPILTRLFNNVLSNELTCINMAVSGTKLTIDDTGYVCGKKRIDIDITPNNPDIIYIDYGFNDISCGVTVDEFIPQFKTYLETIHEKNPNAILVVMDINYALKDNRREISEVFNNRYCELVSSYDYIIYANNYFEVRNAQWLIYDGVHPTDVGQSVYASYLYINALQHMNFGKTYTDNYSAQTLEDLQEKQAEETTTNAPNVEEKSGCNSTLGLSLTPIAFVPLALFKKRKDK